MTHSEYAAGLREIADFLEAHPEIDLPEPQLCNYALFDKAIAARTAIAMADGGRVEKQWAESIFTLSRKFGPVELKYHGQRSNICEQVIVGKKKVEEQFVPFRPAVEAHVVPAHEEPIYEWRCSPLLQKPPVEIEGRAGELESGTDAATLQLEAGATAERETDDDLIPF